MRACAYAFSEIVLIIIWALTSRGYFWPVWPLLAFLLVVGANAVVLFVDENRELFRRPGMSWQLAVQIGLSGVLVLFQVGIWAVTGLGNFWPVWTLLALSIAAAARSAVLYFSPPDQEELTQRIDVLTTTRAGAVDQQEAELRRIERDLHDGAQARLVALRSAGVLLDLGRAGHGAQVARAVHAPATALALEPLAQRQVGLEHVVVECNSPGDCQDQGHETVEPGQPGHEVFENVHQLEQGQTQKGQYGEVVHRVLPPDEAVVVASSPPLTMQ